MESESRSQGNSSGCPRLSRPTHNRARWHQAKPTSTKAVLRQFTRPGHAAPGPHKHFHPLRVGPPGRMITDMEERLSSMKGWVVSSPGCRFSVWAASVVVVIIEVACW